MGHREDQRRLLDPYFVSKLRRLDLIARLVVEGFITGLHKSPYHGFSVEFAEHRPYMPGDPIRSVDWRIFAKTDRYFIKEFEEETNLRSYLLFDISSSMAYRSSDKLLTKLEYGVYLAAALAYLMIQQQDAVGLLTFDEQVRRMIPARSVGAHLRVILGELSRIDPTASEVAAGRRTRIGKSLHYLADRMSRRGLVILLSDLMDDPESVLTGLKHFRHRQHEVVVLNILDPAEIQFPFREETVFIDMETREQISTIPWELAREYRERVESWRQAYRRTCAEHSIGYAEIHTDTPYDVALLRYLEKRRRLH
ncbi:MAG: DUF58 domain-containing protein [Candidatus Eisenbacteria sp.]|nr:DUF58 domain-containing protein [Candidatus Eisenbacteria bacterium]